MWGFLQETGTRVPDWDCSRMSETMFEGDTRGQSLVEDFHTMSSLLPISFVLKLKKTSDQTREDTDSTRTCLRTTLVTPALARSSKHSWKERAGVTTPLCRRVRHREAEGLAQLSSTQVPGPQASGSPSLAHKVSLISCEQGPNQNQNPDCS